jgi:pimeloyl-ACP methyl ester carboxylesterase
MRPNRRATSTLRQVAWFMALVVTALLAFALLATSAVSAQNRDSKDDGGRHRGKDVGDGQGRAIQLARQGFFFVGGQYFTDPGDVTLPGLPATTGPGGERMLGQMYVEYQVPKRKRHPYPVVLIHGGSQTGVNFKGTPDGREGWGTYLLRRGYTVYIVDQVGRGRSPAYNPLPPQPEYYGTPFARPANTETRQRNWTLLEKFALWPNAVLHTQWPGTGEPGDPYFDQFFASQIQSRNDPGGIATQTDAQRAGAALLDRIGPAIVLTHSQSGTFGFLMADARPDLVKGVVTIEGGGTPYSYPIVGPPDYYGDPVPNSPWGIVSIPITYAPEVTDPAQLSFVQEAAADPGKPIKCWLQAEPARQLPNLQAMPHLLLVGEAASAANVNHCVSKYLTQAGVENTWVNLGDVGIHGNGHMMMWERNNLKIAGFIADWLKDNVEKGAKAAKH